MVLSHQNHFLMYYSMSYLAAFNVQFFSIPNAVREISFVHEYFCWMERVKLPLQGGGSMNATTFIANKILRVD